jgi:hypothetical protein
MFFSAEEARPETATTTGPEPELKYLNWPAVVEV